tara:strand:- start:46 stop:876 length:831 start_codon:yes stop_codon:yes gene_type:complete
MICIFTVVHPKSKKFFHSFIDSINKQTYKNFFLFICVNGCNLSRNNINKIKCNHFIFNVNETTGICRKKAFYKLKNFNFKTIVFIDSDDTINKRRLEFDKKNIRNLDFIVTNFYTMDDKGHIDYKKKFFTKIKNNSIIRYSQIRNKNFIGFSNLTIKARIFFSILHQINYKLIALDWCLAKILLLNYYKGKFFNKSLSYYRQYSENVSSVKNKSKNNLLKVIKIKNEHYNFFNQSFKMNYFSEIQRLEILKKKIIRSKNLKNFKKDFFKSNFWWDI